jgi:hypothetical protein
MIYELWERSSRNLIGDFDSEETALELVREQIESGNMSVLDTWLLALEDAAGHTSVLAEGKALIDRARPRRPRKVA